MIRATRLAIGGATAASILLVDSARHFIESRMLLHMLLEFPLLLMSGVATGTLTSVYGAELARVVEKINYRGLTAITLLLCVSAYWMIPASLDNALLQPGVALWKYASWWLAGWMLALSWSHMSDVLIVFMLGNLCWMVGSVGLLYQSSESRLCVNYLIGDQLMTGRALVVLAVCLAVLLAHRVYRSSRTLDLAG